MSNKIFCKICNVETNFETAAHFGRWHLKKVHNITPQIYYDKFLLKDDENICLNPSCENKTKFFSLTEGYQQYCSNKCVQTDPEFLKRREDKYFQETGYRHPRENPEFLKSIEDNNIKKFGKKSYFGTEEFKQKRKESLIERFGTEEYFESDEFKEFYKENKNNMISKARKTIKEKYGVDNPIQSPEIMKKRNESNLSKYGSENVFGNKEIKEQIKKTNLEKYGFKNHNSNEIQKQKKRDYHEKLSDEQKEQRIVSITEGKYKSFLEIIYPIFEQGYQLLKYDVQEKHLLKCPLNHEFEIVGYILFDRMRIPNEIICCVCNPIIPKPYSLAEKELFNFIKDNCDKEVQENVWGLVDKRMELDIYISEMKLGFEYNGLYWHNEYNRGTKYHIEKTELYENEGICLIHIYEDDWLYKKNITKSKILEVLGKHSCVIESEAEMFEIKEVSEEQVLSFLNYNDLMNKYIQGNLSFGLYHVGELVSLMTLEKSYKNIYEITSFCNILNFKVKNSFKILFNHIISKFKPNKVKYFIDRSWNIKEEIFDVGFEFTERCDVNEWFVINGKRHKNLDEYSYKIYDSGSLLFEYVK